jgi:hypothetical protein
MPDETEVALPAEQITQEELTHHSNVSKANSRFKKEYEASRKVLIEKWKKEVPVEPGPLTLDIKKKEDRIAIDRDAVLADLQAQRPELSQVIKDLIDKHTTKGPSHYVRVVPATAVVPDAEENEIVSE